MSTVSGIDLLHQLHRTYNLIHRQYHQSVHDNVGIHHGQGRILSILSHEDGIGQKELAEKLQIRAATLSELLDKLEKNGWVERKNNAHDRRKVNIYITEEGKSISLQSREARDEMVQTIFGVLSEEEKQTLKELLDRLAEGLRQEEQR